MQEQPFHQSERSLLYSRFVEDGSRRKDICQQIRVLFGCECTGKHHAVIPHGSLAPSPNARMFRAHSGENTDNARRD